MGCGASKNRHQSKDAALQCKQRRILLKEVIDARSAFASAHQNYLRSLQYVAVAFKDFFDRELGEHGDRSTPKISRSSSFSSAARRPTNVKLLRSVSSVMMLQSAPMAPLTIVMSSELNCAPEIAYIEPPPPPPGTNLTTWHFDVVKMFEEEEKKLKDEMDLANAEEDVVLEVEEDGGKVVDDEECAASVTSSSSSQSSSEDDQKADDEAGTKNDLCIIPVTREPVLIVKEVYEQFIRASMGCNALCHILESCKEFRGLGFLSNSSSVLSLKQSSSARAPLSLTEDDDDLLREECNATWSHASTLDSLSAWEKKLYQEVKGLEMLNSQFDKKRKRLKKLDGKKGVHGGTIDRERANIKALENQISVAIQAMESTSSSIRKITDEEMHFQLLQLLQGLSEMWREMRECHRIQREAVVELKTSSSRRRRRSEEEEVSECDHKATVRMEGAFRTWLYSLDKMMRCEGGYVAAVRNWLKAVLAKSLQEQEEEEWCKKKKNMGKNKKGNILPEVYYMCEEWWDVVKGVRGVEERVKGVMNEFIVECIERVKLGEMEEMMLRKKMKELKYYYDDELEKKVKEVMKKRSDDVESGMVMLVKLFEGVEELSDLLMFVHDKLHSRAYHGKLAPI